MKRNEILIMFALVFWSAFQTSQASVISGPIVNPTTNSAYFLLSQSNWTDAQTEAVGLGGNLVTINDIAEQNWVFSTFGSFGGVNRHLWIGLNDISTEGVFEWVSGESLTFENWYPGEPNNNLGNESYVHMFAPTSLLPDEGLWNDFVDVAFDTGRSFPLHGVVEVQNAVPVPPPIRMALT